MTQGAVSDGSMEGAVRGVNLAFLLAGSLSVVGLLLAFLLKRKPTEPSDSMNA
ncbi:hypothetical protein JCM19039_3241 [Geomicrobium sp. JCM 19039]|nr:hypothetical protein JCM19039_3241 [Geomicrobium sp. JCM 19039]